MAGETTMLEAVEGLDSGVLRTAFSGFPCGIAALSAMTEGAPSVLIASSFTVGVSMEPPLVMFAVQKTSTTWPQLAEAPVIGVSVLGEAHADKTRQLAAKNKAERFRGVQTHAGEDGALFLHEAPVWLSCGIEHTYPAGDHDIVVLRVLRVRVDFSHQPLLWHRSLMVPVSR
ncbi:flavin reductase family protein [Sediminivirga luteola]|uniref:Oxidoreductase n=1 Tax=Sediminivirga luteola TaxID=1774748 RepID=A0A8J2XL55_9MICO|nr:flavin reductase family protein [Sediminivirga luteola]GGA19339.1 oxidoreductase [Sediminivirga luteola]